jgi:hypothetical protein
VQWGDGYEKIKVIGLHRGSREFVTMIIRADWVMNWRSRVVYDPAVLLLIHEATDERCHDNWSSKEHVESYVSHLRRRATEERTTGEE